VRGTVSLRRGVGCPSGGKFTYLLTGGQPHTKVRGWCTNGDGKSAAEGMGTASDVTSASAAAHPYCPYPPWGLADMLRVFDARPSGFDGKYNEVIVDAAVFRKRVPSALEAFFIPADTVEIEREHARVTVDGIRAALGLTAARFPLVSLNLTAVPAFTCMSCRIL
jgi:hypothetical protein